MDIGGLQIINAFSEISQDFIIDIRRHQISWDEMNMFRMDPLRFGISMEQIDELFRYENVTLIKRMSEEKEGLVTFRSHYCSQTEQRIKSEIDAARRVIDLDKQIREEICMKPEKVPGELFDLFVACLLRNPM